MASKTKRVKKNSDGTELLAVVAADGTELGKIESFIESRTFRASGGARYAVSRGGSKRTWRIVEIRGERVYKYTTYDRKADAVAEVESYAS